MEYFGVPLPAIDRLGAVGTLIFIALLVIGDKLIWHTRLTKAENRADRWEAVALEALTAGAQAGVKAAEVAVGVVSSIPDPQGDRNRAAAAALGEVGGPCSND